MRTRRFSTLPAILVVVVCVAGCSDDAPRRGLDLDTQLERLDGAPAPLAALHGQANQLLDGGAHAFKQQLAKLRGWPVVVNKWASWCPPCRAEFPIFQRVGATVGKRVAFIGVDSDDNFDNAREFLAEYPVSYPTFKDPDLEVAGVFKATVAWPSTAFYNAAGELTYVHHGPYLTDEDLIDDLERYGGSQRGLRRRPQAAIRGVFARNLHTATTLGKPASRPQRRYAHQDLDP